MLTKIAPAALVLGLAFCWPSEAPAQTPWIDAGQQAMTAHQNALLEQQTAPNQDQAERPEEAETPSESRSSSLDSRCREALQRGAARARAELRPEYERRVRTQGRDRANSWLRDAATERGQREGARLREEMGC